MLQDRILRHVTVFQFRELFHGLTGLFLLHVALHPALNSDKKSITSIFITSTLPHPPFKKKKKKENLKDKSSATKPFPNCFGNNWTNVTTNISHQNQPLVDASPLRNLLSTLNHTPVKMTTWRPPKICIPTIQRHLSQQMV